MLISCKGNRVVSAAVTGILKIHGIRMPCNRINVPWLIAIFLILVRLIAYVPSVFFHSSPDRIRQEFRKVFNVYLELPDRLANVGLPLLKARPQDSIVYVIGDKTTVIFLELAVIAFLIGIGCWLWELFRLTKRNDLILNL